MSCHPRPGTVTPCSSLPGRTCFRYARFKRHRLCELGSTISTLCGADSTGLNDNKIPSHTGLEIRKLAMIFAGNQRRCWPDDVKRSAYIISYNIIMLIGLPGSHFCHSGGSLAVFFPLLIKEISTMEHMIRMVSEGRLHEVLPDPCPHNEIQIAVKAISDMPGNWRKESRSLYNRGSWRRWAS